MSSISAASSLVSTLYAPTTQNSTSQALNALGTALQSGDTSDAQTALTALQTTLSSSSPSASSSSTSAPFGNNSQANADFTDLVNNVQSGNLTDAQTALTKLQSDLKTHKGGHGHGHHAAPPPPPDTSDSSTTSTSSTSGNVVNVTV
jgi:hypothetical protein